MADPCEDMLCETGSECRDGECLFVCDLAKHFRPEDGCNTCTCPESGNSQEAACTEEVCDSECSQDADCGDESYCDFADGSCGLLGQKGICQPRATECPEPGGVPTCGCDGATALNACGLANGGTDVSVFGGCETGQPETFACGQQTCDANTDMCSVTGNDVAGDDQPAFFFHASRYRRCANREIGLRRWRSMYHHWRAYVYLHARRVNKSHLFALGRWSPRARVLRFKKAWWSAVIEDHYKTLGVSRSASQTEITAAYRGLVSKYHRQARRE